MKEGSSLANQIDNFNRIILNLEDINVKLEDEDKAIILLSPLPPFYEHFIDTLLYERQSITIANVKDLLSFKEVTKKAETNDGESLMAREGLRKKRTTNRRKWKNLSPMIRS